MTIQKRRTRIRLVVAIVTAALLVVVGGCGKSDSASARHPVVVPKGWTKHSLAKVSIAVPSDWTVVNQEEAPYDCTNAIEGSLLELGDPKTRVEKTALTRSIAYIPSICPSIRAFQADPNYIRILVTRQPTAPVLTTFLEQTSSFEPVNGYPAERLHTPSSYNRDEQNIYLPTLKISMHIDAPPNSELLQQVLGTITAE